VTHEYHLRRKYGITEDQYNDLLRSQNGRCAVCNKAASSFKNRLAVDHDHHSGLVRGLLCNFCNRRIVGRHRKELGAELLLAAYNYLMSDYPGWVVPPKVKRKKRKRNVKRKKNI